MSVTFTALAATGDWARGTGRVIYAGQAEVNCSNVNAGQLLALLGYASDGEPAELYGSADPADFEGRILIAEAFLPQTSDTDGIPAVQDGGPGTGRALLVDCGRAAGYFASRLAELREVAHEAGLHGGEVVWS